MKEIKHIERQIPPESPSSMYIWHKFWARKPYNVVSEYIKSYSNEDDVILDPFSGSGVTGIEALKLNRRVILCDLLPIATEITKLTIQDVSTYELEKSFIRIESKVKDKILNLYSTYCRNCKKEIFFTCSIWEENRCMEIRYVCPYCGDDKSNGTLLIDYDYLILKKINDTEINFWFPKNKLSYPNGNPFKEKQKYTDIPSLFTKRNLLAASILFDAINEEKNKDLKDYLKVCFTSMIHLTTKMMSVRETRLKSSVWLQHSFWYAEKNMEQNVWEKFRNAFNGKQGLLRAKIESNKYFKDIKFANNISQVLNKKKDIFIYTGSCLDLLEEIPSATIDYIFTDPPYGASIQYGELAFLWISWLGYGNDYLNSLLSDEVVINEKQKKDFEVYNSLLKNSFIKMYNVLKNDTYLTVTFHNPTFKIRNSTIRAGIFSGFDFQKIHLQETSRPSPKALSQPFGSAMGDFYLRFYKNTSFNDFERFREISEVQFDKIVVESTIELLAYRGEATPYTIIINYIDPILAKNGFFSSLNTGLDIKKCLNKHLGKEFTLIKTEIGNVRGELWWFNDTSIIPHFEISLSERVEETVSRKLHQKGKVTFTDIWDAVSTEFPNSLTPDQTSIKDALEIYGRPIQKGFWILKDEITRREFEHNEIIAIIAEVGKALGYKIWIGKKEQNEFSSGTFGRKKLREYVSSKIIGKMCIGDIETVSNIDIIWIKNNEIKNIFEIESTTSMTSALNRGSNVTSNIPKFLVIPEEREKQFNRKNKSIMFNERFKNDNWNLLFFDCLQKNFRRLKSGKISIKSIINKKSLNHQSESKNESKSLKLF